MCEILDWGVNALRGAVACLCCVVCLAVVFVLVGAVMLAAPNTRNDDVAEFNAAAANYNETDLPRLLATTGRVLIAGSSNASASVVPIDRSIVDVEVKGNRDGVTPNVESVLLFATMQLPLVTQAVDVELTTTLTGATSVMSGPLTVQPVPIRFRRVTAWCPSDHPSARCSFNDMVTICRDQAPPCGRYFAPTTSSSTTCTQDAACGECYFAEQVLSVCRTIQWTGGGTMAASRWSLTGGSCNYDESSESWGDPVGCPGWSAASQTYDEPLPVSLNLRASTDPWIDLMEITRGSASFGLTEAEQRAIGLALLVIGIVMVVGFGCLIAAAARVLGADGRGKFQQRVVHGEAYQQHNAGGYGQPMLGVPPQTPPPQDGPSYGAPPPQYAAAAPPYDPLSPHPQGQMGYQQPQQQHHHHQQQQQQAGYPAPIGAPVSHGGPAPYNPQPQATCGPPAPLGGGPQAAAYGSAAPGAPPHGSNVNEGIAGTGGDQGWVTSGQLSKPRDPFAGLSNEPSPPQMATTVAARGAAPEEPPTAAVTETHADFFRKRELAMPPVSAAAADPPPSQRGPSVAETHSDFFRKRELEQKAAAERRASPPRRGTPPREMRRPEPAESPTPRHGGGGGGGHDDTLGPVSPVQAGSPAGAPHNSSSVGLELSMNSPPAVPTTPPPSRTDPPLTAADIAAVALPPPAAQPATAPKDQQPQPPGLAPVARSRSDTTVFNVPGDAKAGLNQARLIHVYGSIRETKQEEVPLALSSLDENDAFILDTPDTIWVFQGSLCSPGERAASARLAGELEAARPTAELAVTNSAEAPDAFWRWLGGKGPVRK